MRKKEQTAVEVDGFFVPVQHVEEYIRMREECAAAAEEVFARTCHKTLRVGAGSADGEAVVGLDKTGAIKYLIHLDPSSVKGMSDAMAQDALEYYLMERN